MFGCIEGLVGDFQNSFGVGAVGGTASVTHGRCNRFLFAVWGSEDDVANMVEGREGDNFGGLLIGTREDKGEFFASVPGSEALFTDSFLEGFSYSNENIVSSIVTVGFIEQSKVIYVHHDDSDTRAMASDFIALFSEEILKGSVVAQSGEGVGCGKGFNVFE